MKPSSGAVEENLRAMKAYHGALEHWNLTLEQMRIRLDHCWQTPELCRLTPKYYREDHAGAGRGSPWSTGVHRHYFLQIFFI
jgi:hypothetical protein